MRACVLLMAACASSSPPPPAPPSNIQQPQPAQRVTNLRLMIVPFHSHGCPDNEKLEVTIDGVARIFDSPCAPGADVKILPNGAKVITSDSGLWSHELPPIPLTPGQHVIRIRYAASNVVGQTTVMLPQYMEVSRTGDRPPRLLESMRVTVSDTYEEGDIPAGVQFDSMSAGW